MKHTILILLTFVIFSCDIKENSENWKKSNIERCINICMSNIMEKMDANITNKPFADIVKHCEKIYTQCFTIANSWGSTLYIHSAYVGGQRLYATNKGLNK